MLVNQLRPNNFDLLRLLAACQVVFFHALSHLQIQSNNILDMLIYLLSRFPGVPIFFAISGFLISSSFGRNSNIRVYAGNRFLRIYPGLWFCFLFSVITVTLLGYWPASQASLLSFGIWVGAQTTIAQFYNPDFLRGYGVGVLNGSLWTIPVEIQFYLVIPFIYLFISAATTRKKRIIVAVLTLGFLVIHQLFLIPEATLGNTLVYKLLEVSFIPHLYMFLFGVFVHLCWDVVKPFLEGKAFFWLMAYLASGVILGDILGFKVNHNSINPLSFMLLAMTVFSSAYTFRGVSSGLLGKNDISYGVYLYHMVVINIFVETGFVRTIHSLVTLFLLTIALAFLSWHLVEKRALTLKNFIALRQRGSAQNARSSTPLG